MVRFINKLTGSEMWVAEDRAEEYKAAGHRLAVSEIKAPEAPKATKVSAEKPQKAQKKTTRKAR